MEWGSGESEYEVSFGLAPRNGAVSPSDSQIPDPGLFRFELPAKFGVGWSKLGVLEHIYPEIGGNLDVNVNKRSGSGQPTVFLCLSNAVIWICL